MVKELGIAEGVDCLKNSLAETNAIIDELCTRGGNHLYEQYIQPKVKPYTIVKEQK